MDIEPNHLENSELGRALLKSGRHISEEQLEKFLTMSLTNPMLHATHLLLPL